MRSFSFPAGLGLAALLLGAATGAEAQGFHRCPTYNRGEYYMSEGTPSGMLERSGQRPGNGLCRNTPGSSKRDGTERLPGWAQRGGRVTTSHAQFQRRCHRVTTIRNGVKSSSLQCNLN